MKLPNISLPSDKSRQFRFAALGLLLLTIAIRFPSLLHPMPIDDEAGYSVIANVIVEGGRPYLDAVDRKPPLLFWTYAVVFKIAGEYNWIALHLVSLVWTLATMAGLYLIAQQLFNRETGLTAALLYSVFQGWASFKNLAFNGEMVMNLAIVWAWAIGFTRNSLKWRPELLGAGALLCVAFLLKQSAAIAAIPLGIYLLLPSYRMSRGLTRTQSFAHAVIFTAGFFGVLALFALFLEREGIFRETVYWTIVANTVPYFFWRNGIVMTLAFVGACLLLVIGAVASILDSRALWSGKKSEQAALIGLLAASAIGTAAGSRFYEHYYIQLIPPLSLLAAPYYAQLWTGRIQSRYWLLQPAFSCLCLTVTIVAFSISHWLGAARRAPSETGRYLLGHSTPSDRIFVWGNKPKFYIEARRRPACRYILSFPLTGYIFGEPPGFNTRQRIVPGAWANLEQDFEKHPPAYIVDLSSEPGALNPIRDFPILAKLLTDRYESVARTREGVIYRMH
jgi:Dolichyl-phosphate-mannose-protein mannosyltransferase